MSGRQAAGSADSSIAIKSSFVGTYTWNLQGPLFNKRSIFIHPSLHASLAISPFGDVLHVSPFFGVQRGVRNRGFNPNPDNPENDVLSGYFYYTGGLGIEARYELLSLGAAVTIPVGSPPEIGFGPSLTVTGGVVFR